MHFLHLQSSSTSGTINAISSKMASVFCCVNQVFGLCQYNVKQSVHSRKRPKIFPNASTNFWSHARAKDIGKIGESRRMSSRTRVGDIDDITISGTEEDVSKATLIWRAIKLPIYSVALVPLTVGSAAAYFQTGLFLAKRYFLLLVSSILIITWLNLSNDVYDFDTGADKNKKESVVILVGSRSGAAIVAYLSLVLGFIGLLWISMWTGSVRAILLLACAIICGYVYQCPPFRLSYRGLGEPLCFSAFGPFATVAFYLLLGASSNMSNPPLNGTILSASVLVGFTTSLILFCSHFHQVEEDYAVGKISPLVRVGTERGSAVVKSAVMALYSFLLASGLSRGLPLTCILFCMLTVPMGKLVVTYVQENHKDKGKIFMAKYYCVRLHSLFGIALAAGLVTTRMLRKHIPVSLLS